MKTSDSRLQPVERSAIESALTLMRQPSLSRSLQRHEIPSDVLALIKVSAGDDDLRLAFSEKHNVSEAEVLAASKLYLQTILSTARNDDKRMLCLPQGAVWEDYKEHKKWLLKWLHPDRNRDSWESALFLKVNEAFNRLQVASLDGAAPVLARPQTAERRKQGLRRSRKLPSPAYHKTGFSGLFQQTAKPILIVAGFTLIACLVFFSTLSK
jgi:hypothetical protein